MLNIIIFAAGKGTRLYPITKSIPKPLIEINGRPFLDYVLSELKRLPHRTRIVITYSYNKAAFYRLKKSHKFILVNAPARGHGVSLLKARRFLPNKNPYTIGINADTLTRYSKIIPEMLDVWSQNRNASIYVIQQSSSPANGFQIIQAQYPNALEMAKALGKTYIGIWGAPTQVLKQALDIVKQHSSENIYMFDRDGVLNYVYKSTNPILLDIPFKPYTFNTPEELAYIKTKSNQSIIP